MQIENRTPYKTQIENRTVQKLDYIFSSVRALEKLRERLLPKLMSGEARG